MPTRKKESCKRDTKKTKIEPKACTTKKRSKTKACTTKKRSKPRACKADRPKTRKTVTPKCKRAKRTKECAPCLRFSPAWYPEIQFAPSVVVSEVPDAPKGPRTVRFAPDDGSQEPGSAPQTSSDHTGEAQNVSEARGDDFPDRSQEPGPAPPTSSDHTGEEQNGSEAGGDDFLDPRQDPGAAPQTPTSSDHAGKAENGSEEPLTALQTSFEGGRGVAAELTFDDEADDPPDAGVVPIVNDSQDSDDNTHGETVNENGYFDDEISEPDGAEEPDVKPPSPDAPAGVPAAGAGAPPLESPADGAGDGSSSETIDQLLSNYDLMERIFVLLWSFSRHKFEFDTVVGGAVDLVALQQQRVGTCVAGEDDLESFKDGCGVSFYDDDIKPNPSTTGLTDSTNTVAHMVRSLVNDNEHFGFIMIPKNGDWEKHKISVKETLRTDIGTDEPLHLAILHNGSLSFTSRFGNAHLQADDTELDGVTRQIYVEDEYNGLRETILDDITAWKAATFADKHRKSFQNSAQPSYVASAARPSEPSPAADAESSGPDANAAADADDQTASVVALVDGSRLTINQYKELLLRNGFLDKIIALIGSMSSHYLEPTDVIAASVDVAALQSLPRGICVSDVNNLGVFSDNCGVKYLSDKLLANPSSTADVTNAEFTVEDMVETMVASNTPFGFILVPSEFDWGKYNQSVKKTLLTDIGTDQSLHLAIVHKRKVNLISRFGRAHLKVDDNDRNAVTSQVYVEDEYNGLRQTIFDDIENLDSATFAASHWKSELPGMFRRFFGLRENSRLRNPVEEDVSSEEDEVGNPSSYAAAASGKLTIDEHKQILLKDDLLQKLFQLMRSMSSGEKDGSAVGGHIKDLDMLQNESLGTCMQGDRRKINQACGVERFKQYITPNPSTQDSTEDYTEKQLTVQEMVAALVRYNIHFGFIIVPSHLEWEEYNQSAKETLRTDIGTDKPLHFAIRHNKSMSFYSRFGNAHLPPDVEDESNGLRETIIDNIKDNVWDYNKFAEEHWRSATPTSPNTEVVDDEPAFIPPSQQQPPAAASDAANITHLPPRQGGRPRVPRQIINPGGAHTNDNAEGHPSSPAADGVDDQPAFIHKQDAHGVYQALFGNNRRRNGLLTRMVSRTTIPVPRPTGPATIPVPRPTGPAADPSAIVPRPRPYGSAMPDNVAKYYDGLLENDKLQNMLHVLQGIANGPHTVYFHGCITVEDIQVTCDVRRAVQMPRQQARMSNCGLSSLSQTGNEDSKLLPSKLFGNLSDLRVKNKNKTLVGFVVTDQTMDVAFKTFDEYIQRQRTNKLPMPDRVHIAIIDPEKAFEGKISIISVHDGLTVKTRNYNLGSNAVAKTFLEEHKMNAILG